jgi:hypothetical protein
MNGVVKRRCHSEESAVLLHAYRLPSGLPMRHCTVPQRARAL